MSKKFSVKRAANYLFGSALLLASVASQASTVTLDQKISGDGTFGADGYLSATFEDDGADKVLLTLDATKLTQGKIESWYFNSNIRPRALTISFLQSFSSGLRFNGIDSIEQARNCCSPANGKVGKFDLSFNFNTDGKNHNRLFEAGDLAVFQIEGSGLTADNFLTPSTGGNLGSMVSAAHILKTSNGEGIKIGAALPAPAPVPVPAALWLLGSALTGMGMFARRVRPA